MEILDGKKVSAKVREDLKLEVDNLKKEGINPKLAVIMVGNDPASKVYVRNKNKACEEIGIEYEEFLLDKETTMEELLNVIDNLNKNQNIDGILLQSPIPKHLDINKAFRAILPEKDVDGFHPINAGKLSIGEKCFVPCTPHGVVKIIEEYNIETEGKNVVIVGRSNIVGKPLIQCMLQKNATVTVCHSKTRNLEEFTRKADILIVAIGKQKFITENMVKEGVVVIDIGINRNEEGKLVGDVDFDNVSKKASYITPVPGGVGPMTVAMLMENVVEAAKQNKYKI